MTLLSHSVPGPLSAELRPGDGVLPVKGKHTATTITLPQSRYLDVHFIVLHVSQAPQTLPGCQEIVHSGFTTFFLVPRSGVARHRPRWTVYSFGWHSATASRSWPSCPPFHLPVSCPSSCERSSHMHALTHAHTRPDLKIWDHLGSTLGGVYP